MTTELLSGQRVLVVEDEFLVLMMIEEMLADLGCTSVSTAPSVKKALALVEGQPFDVAMLDVNLGRETSFPIADALATRGVPFLFATGYDVRSQTDTHRSRPVLSKPFGDHELRKALKGLLLASGG
jgi:CheY-like chemotaxis protein